MILAEGKGDGRTTRSWDLELAPAFRFKRSIFESAATLFEGTTLDLGDRLPASTPAFLPTSLAAKSLRGLNGACSVTLDHSNPPEPSRFEGVMNEQARTVASAKETARANDHLIAADESTCVNLCK